MTTYLTLADRKLSRFDPGSGLPSIVQGSSLPVDDTNQLASLLSVAAIAGVALSQSPSPPASPNAAVPNVKGELFYVENVTNTPTVLSAAGVAVPGCVGAVQPNARPCYVQGKIEFQITTAGAGALIVAIYETTTGAPVFFRSSGMPVTALAGAASKYCTYATPWYRLGPVAAGRTFALYGFFSLDASSPLVANARNAPSAGSYLAGEAR